MTTRKHKFGAKVAVIGKRWLRREWRWIVDGADWRWVPVPPALIALFYGAAYLMGRF